MAEMVFSINNTALEAIKNLEIEANFKEMEKALAEAVEPYKNLVVTEDGLPQAKADRAKLNKVKTNIDDQRKTVKKVYSEPLKAFEEKCKRLTAICEEGAANLDIQIKEFENNYKQQKLNSLFNYFGDLPKRNPEFMDFKACNNPKWTNATYPIETAQMEIQNYVMKVDNDVDSIKSLGSKFETMLLDEYRKTGDVSTVLILKKRAEDAEAENERRRAETERRKAEAEAARLKAEEEKLTASQMRRQEIQNEVPVSKSVQPPTAFEKPNYVPRKYVVTCKSKSQEDTLVDFCVSHGLQLIAGGLA